MRIYAQVIEEVLLITFPNALGTAAKNTKMALETTI